MNRSGAAIVRGDEVTFQFAAIEAVEEKELSVAVRADVRAVCLVEVFRARCAVFGWWFEGSCFGLGLLSSDIWPLG